MFFINWLRGWEVRMYLVIQPKDFLVGDVKAVVILSVLGWVWCITDDEGDDLDMQL